MAISKLVVSGYKRLFLNNISHIELNPKNSVQLILGTNGSGKSSLLRVVNPLPDDKNAYKDGGYKEYHDDHNGHAYELTFNKLAPGKYSFKMDNQELNMSGTKRAQLHLTEEHFNLTPKSNEIVLGTAKFSSMSLLDRKYWFRHMSNTDYAFSIKLYNDLKSRLRDIRGGIKLLNNEIVVATSHKLLDDDDLLRHTTNKEKLEELITELSYGYRNDLKELPKVDIFKEISNETSKIERMLTTYDTKTPIQTLESLKIGYEKELTFTNKEIDAITDRLDKLDSVIDTSNMDKVKIEIEYLTHELDELKATVYLDVNLDELEQLHDRYTNAHSDIISYVLALENYKSIDLSKVTEKDTRDAYMASNAISLKLSAGVASLKQELKDIIEAKTEDNKLTCKKCGEITYIGYSLDREQIITSRLKDKENKLEEQVEKHTVIKNTYEQVHAKMEIHRALHSYIVKAKLSSIITLIQIDRDITHYNDKELMSVFNKLLVNLEKWRPIPKKVKRLAELEYDYKLMEESDLLKKKLVSDSKNNLEDKLADTIANKKILLYNLDKVGKDINTRNTLDVSVKHLKKLIRATTHIKRRETLLEEQNILKTLINNLKEELYTLDETIVANNKIKDKITNNQKTLTEYKEIEEVLKVTLDALCPTSGLIGKSIMSFVNSILSDMNNIINSVWSYNIELLPCAIDDDNDLDYKFRVKVDNNKDPIDDISSLSTSMQDMVDLAFKIVFMKYARLTHMPLFLDEFGVTMDAKHRQAVYHVLDNILSMNFNQLFITAHFKSMYGRFTNADMTILDARNIELSKGTTYNTTTIIK